ncbi:hypothetical protein ACP70R_011566 [Stipagrostis hirtigluma subsp. patula]
MRLCRSQQQWASRSVLLQQRKRARSGMRKGCGCGRAMEEAEAQAQSAAGKLACGAIVLESLWLGFLPFLDAICGLVSHLWRSTAIHTPCYGKGFMDSLNSYGSKTKFIAFKDNYLRSWHLCSCNAGAPSPSLRSHTKQREAMPRRSRDSSFRRLMARSEQCLTYAVVVAALQVFLHLTRANASTPLLPMLSRATGCRRKAALIGDAVLALVNAAGVLGAAVATRRYGREAMCAVSGALIVFCQIAAPTMMGAQAGLGGGGARTTARHAAAMFAAACGVSGGFSWSWGALFWAVPAPGEGQGRTMSLGQAAAAALGLAQMQCFLLTLRQLKHAAVAYYTVWIWS